MFRAILSWIWSAYEDGPLPAALPPTFRWRLITLSILLFVSPWFIPLFGYPFLIFLLAVSLWLLGLIVLSFSYVATHSTDLKGFKLAVITMLVGVALAIPYFIRSL